MKRGLCLLFLVGLWMGGPLVWPRAARAQMTFEGLDLSDDGEDEGKDDTGKDATGDDVEIQIGGSEVSGGDETMSFEGMGLDLSDEEKSAAQRALDAAVALYDGENYDAAAVAFYKILQDPKAAEHHQQAEYLLAKSLYKMGLYHSALAYFKRILSAGEAHKYFSVSLEWLFFISRKMVNESVVLEDIAAYADKEFPEKYRDEFLYLLAKYHFTRGRALMEAGESDEAEQSFAEADRLLGGISDQTKFYPKALFLQGLILYQRGDANGALAKFKEVVKLTSPRTGRLKNTDLRDLAYMQLARLHYEHKQNVFAAGYYNKIPRDSEQWLQSLFESSWAYFRLGDYERALGNMVTLHSPFFADEYFPESLILKAVIYYENCRYPEAKLIVEEFESIYGPVHEELAKLAASGKTPVEYYELLADVQRRERAGQPTSGVLARILKAALTDKEFKAMNDSIQEVEREMDSIAEQEQVFKFSPLAKELLEHLKSERQELIQKAGLMASAKLYAEKESLKDLLSQGLRIRFETQSREKEFLEKQLQAGGKLDVVQAYGYSVAVSDEELYWPYEGEYWRDELGTYQYTLTKGCKERLAAGAGAGK
ncbi:MAG: hypothetical protein D6729_10145 [Deltaproteobacteria bacterium]|nr:MAG: hypothetical protein D6729_10145 [Deltaproteobacteria bacterium]